MRTPDFSNSAERLLDEYGLYHLSRLEANPRTAHLCEPFRRIQERLAQRLRESRASAQATIRAIAARDAACEETDDLIKRLTLPLEQDGSLEDSGIPPCPGPTAASNPRFSVPIRERVDLIRRWIESFQDDPDRSLHHQLSRLTQAVDRLAAADSEHRVTLALHAELYRELEEEKRSWLAAYRQSAASLESIYPGDPKRILRYFRPARRGSGGESSVYAGIGSSMSRTDAGSSP